MITKSTPTTTKLEGYARRNYNKDYGIVVSPDNASGKYFIVNEDGQPLRHWMSLGWTAQDAIERLAMYSAD